MPSSRRARHTEGGSRMRDVDWERVVAGVLYGLSVVALATVMLAGFPR